MPRALCQPQFLAHLHLGGLCVLAAVGLLWNEDFVLSAGMSPWAQTNLGILKPFCDSSPFSTIREHTCELRIPAVECSAIQATELILDTDAKYSLSITTSPRVIFLNEGIVKNVFFFCCLFTAEENKSMTSVFMFRTFWLCFLWTDQKTGLLNSYSCASSLHDVSNDFVDLSLVALLRKGWLAVVHVVVSLCSTIEKALCSCSPLCISLKLNCLPLQLSS